MVIGLQVVRLLPQSATCQTFGWGEESVRNSQTVLVKTMKDSGNKDHVIRLSEQPGLEPVLEQHHDRELSFEFSLGLFDTNNPVYGPAEEEFRRRMQKKKMKRGPRL
jgi:hypothetical protein